MLQRKGDAHDGDGQREGEAEVGHRRDQYKRCAHLLEAVSQLLEHFAHYQEVPKIQGLTRRLSTVQVRLLREMRWDEEEATGG